MKNKIKEENLVMEFDKKEYWSLMRAIYIADWVANASCDAASNMDKGIIKIRNKVYMEAMNMGYGDYVESDSEKMEVYPSYLLDDNKDVRRLIERYDEEVFWDELVDEMVKRDIKENENLKEIAKMEMFERFRMECKYEEKWDKEFVKNGVENLVLKSKNKV